MSTVVSQLASQMDANRVARRAFFGEKMNDSVTDAVAKMDAAVAADAAAVTARDNADAASLTKYNEDKSKVEVEIAQMISDLKENDQVGAYADDMKELKDLVSADVTSATAQLAAYVSAETQKTEELINDFGTLADVEAEFAGFLAG